MTALSDDAALAIADFLRRPLHSMKVFIRRWRFDRAFIKHLNRGDEQTASKLWRAGVNLHVVEPFVGVHTVGDIEEFLHKLSERAP